MRYDHKGNIALYIDAIKMKGEDTFEDISDVASERLTENKTLYRISYIPVSEIQRVQFGLQSIISEKTPTRPPHDYDWRLSLIS